MVATEQPANEVAGKSRFVDGDVAEFLPPGVTAQAFYRSINESRSWIHRRVFSVRFREDGCTHQRVSLDLSVPELLAPSAADSPGGMVIPIGHMRKGAATHRLDVRDASGTALSILQSTQQAVLLRSFIWESLSATIGESVLAEYLTPSLSADITALAEQSANTNHSADAGHGVSAASVVDVDSLIARISTAIQGIPAIQVQQSELIVELVQLHGDAYILAVVVPTKRAGERILLKWAIGNAPPTLRRVRLIGWWERFGARIGLGGPAWRTFARVRIHDRDARRARTTHVEFGAPDNILVKRAWLGKGDPDSNNESVSKDDNLKLDDKGIHPRRVSRIFFSAADVDESRELYYGVRLVPERSALTRYARWAPLVVLAVLSVVTAASLEASFAQHVCETEKSLDCSVGVFAHDEFGRSAPVFLAIMSVSLTWLAQKREHSLASLVLAPLRRVVVLCGASLAISALVVAFLQPGYVWIALTPMALGLFVLLNRAAATSKHVAAYGQWRNPKLEEE